MEAAALKAVWLVVLHFTVLGYHGRALPEGAAHRTAFEKIDDCRKAIPVVRRALRTIPVQPDKIVCEKMEVK